MKDEKLIARKGRKEYQKFLNKEPLSYKSAILAQCYVCYTDGADTGELDCLNRDCPLYIFMPYNPNKRKKVLTDEQKAKITEQLLKGKNIYAAGAG